MAETTVKRSELEIWKNVGNGLIWVTVLNPQGAEVTKEVRGRQTFTISPFHRQMNQYAAASPELDMFRNGRLILIRATDDTELDEIESAESKTDAELAEIVITCLHKPEFIDRAIAKITSPTTLSRLQEEFLLVDDVSATVLEKIKSALRIAEGRDDVVEREAV